MLPADSRLRHRDEFSAAVRGGRRVRRGSLVLHRLDAIDAGRAPEDAPRIGFIVSKSVGSAVVRNRVTRRLRHLCRERLAGVPGGSRTVVRALPASSTCSFGQLGRDLDGALDRMGRRR